jgi:PKD repeat protein
MSEGIADTANSTNGTKAYASFSLATAGNTVNVTNLSVNTTANNWNFGDGGTATTLNASHTYTTNGTYTITLISSNSCNSDTAKLVVVINSVGISEMNEVSASVFPNPTDGKFSMTLDNTDNTSYDVFIYNQEGKLLLKGTGVKLKQDFDLSGYRAGIYLLQLRGKDKTINKKFVLE